MLSGAELLASYRKADQYVGDRGSQSELEGLRLCRRIVMASVALTQRTLRPLAPTAPATRATNLAQSALEDCEQDFHEHGGGVLPDNLNFFSRRRLRQTVAC